MPVVNVDIPVPLKERLVAESERRGVSQRVVAILTLEAYLPPLEKPSDESAQATATGGSAYLRLPSARHESAEIHASPGSGTPLPSLAAGVTGNLSPRAVASPPQRRVVGGEG